MNGPLKRFSFAAILMAVCATTALPSPGGYQRPAQVNEQAVKASLGRCLGEPGFDPTADLNQDGCVNVLDVKALQEPPRGESTWDHSNRTILRGSVLTETITSDPTAFMIAQGTTRSFLILLQSNTTPLFGYSLDIDIVPSGTATGTITADVTQTNFYLSQNMITQGGGILDPTFSVITDPGDGGVFVSANTDDGSTVLAVDGTNDVLAQVFVVASSDAMGDFTIELGAATALSDGSGFAVPFDFVPIPVTADATVPVLQSTWGSIKEVFGETHVPPGP